MPIIDGQPVSAAITNPTFIYKNTDDSTTGILGLLNTAPASGATIANPQGAINHALNTTGATVTTDGTTYTSQTVITNGQNHQVALGLLDQRFNGTTGHTHDGTPGNGPIITAAVDPNAIYRNGTQPPTADQPWATFGIKNLGYLESTSTPLPTTGFLRLAFGDAFRWRNSTNTGNSTLNNTGLAFTIAQVNNSNSPIASSQQGLIASVQRTATGSVTDTQPIVGMIAETIIDIPAINTYSNTQSISGLLIAIANSNTCAITTPFYALLNFNSDTVAVTGRKYGTFLPSAITGGTAGNAIVSDSATFSGTFAYYVENSNPSFFNGAMRIGTSAGGPVFGATTEKLSIQHTISAAPATIVYSLSNLLYLNTTAPITVQSNAIFSTIIRNSSVSVTDTGVQSCVNAQYRVDLPAGQVYTSSVSVNAFNVDALLNTNACTIAIASYRAIRIQADTTAVTGKKIAIRWSAFSGGTTGNAILADSEIVGSWFISKTADSNPSIINGSFVNATAALATNATTGFIYFPTCPGTPTGVPATFTGTDAVVIDSTGGIPYFYNAGAWVPFGTYTFQLSAAQMPSTVTAAATYNVAANDVVVRVDSTANAITVKLPNPATSRRFLTIVDVGYNLATNQLNVQQFNTEKVYGTAATLVLSSNGGSWSFVSDLTNWIPA